MAAVQILKWTSGFSAHWIQAYLRNCPCAYLSHNGRRARQKEDKEAAPEEEAQGGPSEDGGRAGREPHPSTSTRSVWAQVSLHSRFPVHPTFSLSCPRNNFSGIIRENRAKVIELCRPLNHGRSTKSVKNDEIITIWPKLMVTFLCIRNKQYWCHLHILHDR